MRNTTRQLVIAGTAIAAILLVAGAVDVALAQGSPFGAGAPKSAPATPYTGIVGWIMVKQAEFYKGLSGAIRAAKTDNSALWVLFGHFLKCLFRSGVGERVKQRQGARERGLDSGLAGDREMDLPELLRRRV